MHRPDQAQGLPHPELSHHVVAHLRRGGRREGVNGRVRKGLAQSGKSPVLGPEVMAPLADAVRLVDAETAHAARGEHARESRSHGALGRGEDDRHAGVAHERLDLAALGVGRARVQCGRLHAHGPQ